MVTFVTLHNMHEVKLDANVPTQQNGFPQALSDIGSIKLKAWSIHVLVKHVRRQLAFGEQEQKARNNFVR